MLEIQNVDGLYCPYIIVCDICKERLTEVGKAAVVYPNFLPNNSKTALLHVHKGQIDSKNCHAKADAIIISSEGTPGWIDMKEFLLKLVINTGFPLKIWSSMRGS